MVGDSWQRDILGAMRMGMEAIFVDRGRSAPGDCAPAPTVPTVSGLDDLIGTIDRLSREESGIKHSTRR